MADPTLVNSGEGTSTGQSVTATFGFTSTSGNLLVFTFTSGWYLDGTPSGWTIPTNGSREGNHGHYVLYKISAGESSLAFDLSDTGGDTAWAVAEFDNIDTGAPFDIGNGQLVDTGGTTYETQSVVPSTGRRLSIGVIAGVRFDTGMTNVGTWTNSYTEARDSLSASGESHSVGIGYLLMDGNGVASTSTGITFDSGATASGRSAIIAVFNVETEGGGGGLSIPIAVHHYQRMQRQ